VACNIDELRKAVPGSLHLTLSATNHEHNPGLFSITYIGPDDGMTKVKMGLGSSHHWDGTLNLYSRQDFATTRACNPLGNGN
jgi:hypothetical protein